MQPPLPLLSQCCRFALVKSANELINLIELFLKKCLRTDSAILSPLQHKQEGTLEEPTMSMASHTPCQGAAAVPVGAASVELRAASGPVGSINSQAAAAKVWEGRPFKILPMLHGQHNKRCWVSSGQQEAASAAPTAKEGRR